MGGGQARRHGHRRKQRQQGKNGLDAFACRHDVFGRPEPHRMAQQIAHRAPRFWQRGLAAAVAGEPGALQPEEIAAFIGHDAQKRGPFFPRSFAFRTVEARWVEPQRWPGQSRRDAPPPQIDLGDRARDRLRQGVQTRCSGGRAGLPFKEGIFGCPDNDRLAEKAPGFIERRLKAGEASGEADEVEEIAMLPRRRVDLMCNCT